MKTQAFSLLPFPTASPVPGVKITGIIARRSKMLDILLEVHGPLAEIVIPPPAEVTARKHGLWEETCFEFFLAIKNSPRYWEFNLSPAGHWNVYRFAAYRQGMEEEEAFSQLPFSFMSQRDALLFLALEFDLTKIIPPDQALEIAISAIIKHRYGEPIYLALTHPGPQPNFHRRDSFIIEL
jgi:hypothetical protein